MEESNFRKIGQYQGIRFVPPKKLAFCMCAQYYCAVQEI